jgi:DNA-binding CsgD family transcriptional regulator
MPERLRTRIEEVTSRQMEVARLVAEGRTNPEIASDLGITLDGAKYHVSELLGRLGLERREEIADWYRTERRGQRVRRFSALFATAPRAFLAAAAATAVVAVGVLFAVALEGGRADDPVAAASPTPTATTVIEAGAAPPVGATGDAADLPTGLQSLPETLAQRLRSTTLPTVVSWERVDWFDGCFDMPFPGGCPLSVSPVPGYRVLMELDGEEYLARSDIGAGRYALEDAPPIAPFETVYEWVGFASGGLYPCLQVRLDQQGLGDVASCGEAPTPIDVSQTAVGSTGLLEVMQAHLPARFDTSTVDESRFDDSAERALYVWGRYLAIESYTGRDVGPGSLAIGWHNGMSDGCQSVWIERFGVARLSDCPEGEQTLLLDSQDLARIYGWLDGHAFFRRPEGIQPPGTGDEDYLVVAGSGSERLPDATQTRIEAWLLALAEGATASE